MNVAICKNLQFASIYSSVIYNNVIHMILFNLILQRHFSSFVSDLQ